LKLDLSSVAWCGSPDLEERPEEESLSPRPPEESDASLEEEGGSGLPI
jgi:hypothetical protein